MTSQKERLFWVVFFVLVFTGLLAGLIYLIIKQKQCDSAVAQVTPVNKETCLTTQCTLTASMLIEAMDTTVDPCDDFYAFACGNFIRNNPVPEDEDFRGAAWTFNEKFDVQMKNLMEGIGSLQGPKVMYRMQEAYHVCLNTTYQRKQELAAVKNYIQKVLNWPLASPGLWHNKFNSFTSYLADYEEKGIFHMFASIRVYTTSDGNNAAPYKITIDNPFRSFIPPHDADDALKAMVKKLEELTFQLIRDLVHLFGNREDDVIERDFAQYHNFSKYYEEMIKSKEESYKDENLSNVTVSPTKWKPQNRTFRELHQLTGGKINWLHVINKKLKGRYEFKEDDIVFLDDIEMFDILKHALERFNLRTLVNVLGWSASISVLNNGGPDVEELLHDYLVELLAIQNIDEIDRKRKEKEIALKPRWKKCFNLMNQKFKLVVTRMFLEAYVDRNDKQTADEMIQLIQEAYKDAIRKSPWLDDKTRYNAIKKADAIKRYVAYPDFIFDDEALDKRYKKVLPVVQSLHFENSLEMQKHNRYDSLPDLDENSDETEEWNPNLLIVDAFYSQRENSIMFPLATLQLPFFQRNRLAAMNFGMIGTVIGHEIGHAFDNRGSRFDDKGDYNNWWSNSMPEEFDKRSECFVEQYNAYCPEFLRGTDNGTDVCLKGDTTLEENMADYTGLTASFEAYKLWVKKHGAEKRLPGLSEYSPEQLFFISNAYVDCENIPPHKLYQWNMRSPGKYRVVGRTSNSAFFREAFKCPVGPMNRGDKSCTVW